MRPISAYIATVSTNRFLAGEERQGASHNQWSFQPNHQRINGRKLHRYPTIYSARQHTAAEAMRVMRTMMQRLKLEVNEDKTGLRRIPEQSVDFLGYTIGRCYSTQTGRAYIGTCPAAKSVRRVSRAVSDLTRRRMTRRTAEETVGRLNRLLTGWGNYFCLGPVSKAYRAVDRHSTARLRWWLCHKHKQAGKGTSRYPNEYLYDTLGLVCLPQRTRNFPWAKA
jgi:hypothetical protein